MNDLKIETCKKNIKFILENVSGETKQFTVKKNYIEVQKALKLLSEAIGLEMADCLLLVMKDFLDLE